MIESIGNTESQKRSDMKIQALIERYQNLFPNDQGVSEKDLHEAEKHLGLKFPDDFRVIAHAYGGGYLGGCSLFTLYDDGEDYNIVNKTLHYRECDLHLPHRYLALEETGVSFVVLDTSTSPMFAGRVIECSIEDIYNLAAGDSLRYDHDIYNSFSDYFEYLVKEEEEERAEDNRE